LPRREETAIRLLNPCCKEVELSPRKPK
jgi:hypothetical protein